MRTKSYTYFPVWKSISTPFIALAIVLVLGTASVVGVMQYLQNRAAIVERERERLHFAIQKSSLILQEIHSNEARAVLTLAETPPLQGIIRARENGGYDPEDNSTEKMWLDRLAQIFLANVKYSEKLLQVRLIDAAGMELLRINNVNGNAARVPDDLLQDKSQRDYVQKALQLPKGKVAFFGIDLNREFGEISLPETPILRIATPITDANDKVFGILITNIGVEKTLADFSDAVPAADLLFLTNSKGDYISHHDPSMEFGFEYGREHRIQDDYPEIASIFAADAADSLSIQTDGSDNTGYIAEVAKIYYDSSQQGDYLVMAAISPKGELFATQTATRNQIIAVTLSIALVSAAMAMLIVRRIISPLVRLTSVARQLETGSRSTSLGALVDRSDEIGVLARAISRTTQALQEKGTRLQSILEGANNPIITADALGRIQDVNKATTKMLGYNKSELVGQNVGILMNPDDAEDHPGYLTNYQSSAPERVTFMGREVMARRKDGSEVPVQISVSKSEHSGGTQITAIMTDLTEQKKVEQLKNEFISTVSHELRTPLTSIKGSLSLLKASVLGDLPEQARPMVEIALNNSNRLVRLINSILDIEKMEAGKMSFDFKPLNLGSFLERSVEGNKGYASELGVKVELSPVDHNLRIEADSDRMQQVIDNLLSNAAKFSPRGGTIKIDTELRNPNTVRISVRDEGPGIPLEFQEKLFEKFAQADATNTRTVGGTGLGLTIAKSFVEAHSGSIGFTTQKDVGTSFYIDLPVLKQSTHRKRKDHEKPMPRVLICEDDADHIEILSQLAEPLANIAVARTCERARLALEEQKFDLVILDLIMSDGSGEDLLPLIKSQKPYAPKVLLFSISDQVMELAPKVDAALLKSQSSTVALRRQIELLLSDAAKRNEAAATIPIIHGSNI
ncbi:MAG: PAS domain S-box protein [Rhodobacteraceae bacterium]|nr:PAS domain S-box protein [Paracoccaceae bacterium]